MIKTYLFVVLSLLSKPILAGVELEIHGFSKHFVKNQTYNETNTGLGLNWNTKNYFLSAGTFKNSLYKKSVYISAGYHKEISENIQLGLDFGAVTGYTDIRLILLPNISYKLLEALALKFRFSPPIKSGIPMTISVSAVIKF